jgi:hypothetical protein
MSLEHLQSVYQALQAEATALAGGLADLAQRATVYHHVFRASQGNHAFPLIAAHGALWAGGYFQFGMRLGRWLAWQYAYSGTRRRRQLERLADFRDALREINRRVCVDTYVSFYLTCGYGRHPQIDRFVPANLLDALHRVHRACRHGRALNEAERRRVFEAHFLHEQETVVGQSLERATAEFAWPLVKFLALRPRVRFAYLPDSRPIVFTNFADKQQRIANGLRAFDAASHAGWPRVERALADYGLLPQAYLRAADARFAALRRRVAARPLGVARPPRSPAAATG